MMIAELLASSRAAEYEGVLREAINWADWDAEHSGRRLLAFCKTHVWPKFVDAKKEAYEFIPDDLRQIYEC